MDSDRSSRTDNSAATQAQPVDPEAFSERLTFTGRLNQFVIARDTFISAPLYHAWHQMSLVDGALVSGMRVRASETRASTKAACKWRAVCIDSIDPPGVLPLAARTAVGMTPRRTGSIPSGEAFSEEVTFAGRADQFVVVGHNTYVVASLIRHLMPIYEGDRLLGLRVRNQGSGKSKWTAVSVSSVERATGPPLSAHDIWLDEAHALLARICHEHDSFEKLDLDLLGRMCPRLASNSASTREASAPSPTYGISTPACTTVPAVFRADEQELKVPDRLVKAACAADYYY
jgi:hypothetical protein